MDELYFHPSLTVKECNFVKVYQHFPDGFVMSVHDQEALMCKHAFIDLFKQSSLLPDRSLPGGYIMQGITHYMACMKTKIVYNSQDYYHI